MRAIRNFLFAAILYFRFDEVICHGRLLSPVGRSTMWRYGYKTPENYDDNQLYCGGISIQWLTYGGKCGPCGDPWGENDNGKRPRSNEAGGKYGNGIIVQKYEQGSTINASVHITVFHLGFFEFKLCPTPNDVRSRSNETCFEKHRLQVSGREDYRYYPKDGAVVYNVTLELPHDLTCERCVFLWRYQTGNSWGRCDNNTFGLGCGPQEEFRGCADVEIFERRQKSICDGMTDLLREIERRCGIERDDAAFEPRNVSKIQNNTDRCDRATSIVKSLNDKCANIDGIFVNWGERCSNMADVEYRAAKETDVLVERTVCEKVNSLLVKFLDICNDGSTNISLCNGLDLQQITILLDLCNNLTTEARNSSAIHGHKVEEAHIVESQVVEDSNDDGSVMLVQICKDLPADSSSEICQSMIEDRLNFSTECAALQTDIAKLSDHCNYIGNVSLPLLCNNLEGNGSGSFQLFCNNLKIELMKIELVCKMLDSFPVKFVDRQSADVPPPPFVGNSTLEENLTDYAKLDGTGKQNQSTLARNLSSNLQESQNDDEFFSGEEIQVSSANDSDSMEIDENTDEDLRSVGGTINSTVGIPSEHTKNEITSDVVDIIPIMGLDSTRKDLHSIFDVISNGTLEVPSRIELFGKESATLLPSNLASEMNNSVNKTVIVGHVPKQISSNSNISITDDQSTAEYLISADKKTSASVEATTTTPSNSKELSNSKEFDVDNEIADSDSHPRCFPKGLWKNVPDMDIWCHSNCFLHLPSSSCLHHCKCPAYKDDIFRRYL